jgi:murein DD-endopeptidase MepM/ murein hydrolase activator NlpD
MSNCPPYKNCKLSDLTQGYSEKHPANDFCPFPNPNMTPLVSPCNGRVCSIVSAKELNEEMTEEIRGYGIMVSDNNSGMHYVYWHCQPVFPVNLWQNVKQGEIIAYMGNSGDCYASGVFVPTYIRLQPPFLGTHLHYEAFILNEKGTRVYYDPLTLIDFSIPINPNILETMKQVLLNMLKLIKGRSN